MKKKIMAALIAISLLSLSGCKEEKVEDKTKIIIPIKVGFNSIAPDTDVSAATKEVIRNMNTGLIKFDPDSKTLVPALAKSYEIKNNGRTYIFKLRDDIFFHNNKKITPEDVKYSFERVSGINTGKVIVGEWNKKLESINVLDENTIEINIKDSEHSSSDIYNITDVSIIPKGISENELEKNPIGAGPYKFVEYIPGQKIVLEAFENYYLGVPEIEEVEFKIYKEFLDIFNLDIRKLAHFTIYLILGSSYFLSFKSLDKKSAIISITLTFLYACTDEFHQGFVPGRGPALKDVFIDTLGGCLGIVLIFLFFNSNKKPIIK